MARVSVVGCGYVGLVTGCGLASLGHEVTCIEIDPRRLAQLEGGRVPFHEPGLQALYDAQRAAGRLCITGDFATGLRAADIAMLAVNTPPSADGAVDTTYVLAAARTVAAHAEPGTVVVVKSTVPPGTCDEVERLLTHLGAPLPVVSNPEFLREGSALDDFMRPDRIVVGASGESAGNIVAALYASLEAQLVRCSRRGAELAKYACNAYLATRISFINEIASICGAADVDVHEIQAVLGSDRRIGPAFLQAGLGWGGSCFPKDVRGIVSFARALGSATPLMEAAFEVNAAQRATAVEWLLDAVRDATAPCVAVLGLAFKPGTDDLRESPALDVIRALLEAEVRVRAFDPVAMPAARAQLDGVEYCDDAYAAASGAHALMLATDWPECVELDWRYLATRMRQPVVLDGRNALDPRAIEAAGCTYLSFGRMAVCDTAEHNAESVSAEAIATGSLA